LPLRLEAQGSDSFTTAFELLALNKPKAVVNELLMFNIRLYTFLRWKSRVGEVLFNGVFAYKLNHPIVMH
jgi:hypothetical protein